MIERNQIESAIKVGELNVEIKKRSEINTYLAALRVAQCCSIMITIAILPSLPSNNGEVIPVAITACAGILANLAYYTFNDDRLINLKEIRENIQESILNFEKPVNQINKPKRSLVLGDDGELVESEKSDYTSTTTNYLNRYS